MALREAILVNGMLTNAEIWYSIKASEIKDLEEVDKLLIRRILEAPASACIESLYLEMGLIPLSIMIKARRVNYLHYLVNLNKSEMLYKVFETQWKYPGRGDWTEEVKVNLIELDINLSIDEMRKKSKNSFKRMVKIHTQEYTLAYLLKIKESHTKMENLHYTEIKLQNYLKNSEITVEEARNLFKYRTRVAHFKENMKSSYASTVCPLCMVQPDTQTHSMQCPEVKLKTKIEGHYSDIFSENIPSTISKTLLNIFKLREEYL